MELPANELTKGRAQKPTELRKETFLFCQKQLSSYVIIAYLIMRSFRCNRLQVLYCFLFLSIPMLLRFPWDLSIISKHFLWKSTFSREAIHLQSLFVALLHERKWRKKKFFLHQIPFVFDGQSTSSKGIWDHNKEDLGTLASTLVRTSALALPSL